MNANRLPLVNDSGTCLPCELVQLRLRVEEFELARPAGHEQEDDRLRLRRRSAASSARAGRLRSARRRRRARAATPSAIAPTPTPQSRKKCRRVRASVRALSRSCGVMCSPHGRRLPGRQSGRGVRSNADWRRVHATTLSPMAVAPRSASAAVALRASASLPGDELVEVHQHAGHGAQAVFGSALRCASRYASTRPPRRRRLAGEAERGTRTRPCPRRPPGLPSRSACRAPSANSTNTGSFARCSAWSGVLLRFRFVQAVWASAASNVVSSGCWRLPPDVRVHPAAVAVRALALRPRVVALREREHLLRLRRVHARPADLRVQQPARRQRRVADDLGFEPQARLPAEEQVARVLRGEVRAAPRTTAGRSPTSR